MNKSDVFHTEITKERRNVSSSHSGSFARSASFSFEQTERLIAKTVEKYPEKASWLVVWMEENLPDGFAIFASPARHRRRLRTTNMVKRQHRELKRRTQVSGLFPNEASLLRLVSAIPMEVSGECESHT